MTTTPSTRVFLIGSTLAALTLASCSEFEIQNKPPVARAKLLVNGVETDPTMPIAYAGASLAITLDGTTSNDEDGSITAHLWMDTAAPAYERFAGNGMVDSGTLPAFNGDPPAVAAPQLMLGEGTFKYSLWVTDDEKYTSAPATLAFRICAPPCM